MEQSDERLVMDVLEQAFPALEPAALEVLSSHGEVVTHAAGEVLCHQGEYEDDYSVIISGQADVYINQPSGRAFVAYLRGGQTLGGLEYINGTTRIADVVASEPVVALRMSFADLDQVAAEHPAVVKEIAREVLNETLRSQDRFMELSAERDEQARGIEVFVSYARADVDFARRLTTGLRRHEIAVWLDVFNIAAGKSWNRQIGEALDRCGLMVLIVSPSSMSSENSDDEWNYFLDKCKEVIPVIYERAEIPYRLNKLQYIDFSSQPFDSALAQLVLAIKRAATDAAPGTSGSAAGAERDSK